MSKTHMHPETALCLAGGFLYVLFVVRRFSADSLVKRTMAGCVLCLLAIAVVGESGDAGARVRAAGSLGMGVGMAVVVLFAVMRLRLSR
jgi:hypothetical protein